VLFVVVYAGCQRGNTIVQLKRTKVVLLPGWEQIENPTGLPTFATVASGSSNVLQISHAEYCGGKVPNPSEQVLVRLSEDAARESIGPLIGATKVIRTDSGKCAFGQFGTAIVRGTKFPMAQVWHLSDGRDAIFATYICEQEPTPQELTEVEEIVRSLKLRPPDEK
jgi:hypothetical protein